MTQKQIKACEEYFDNQSNKDMGREAAEILFENIKWEQRRYEIAKDCLAAMVASDESPFVSKTQIGVCVRLADELISVLRKSKVTYGVIK